MSELRLLPAAAVVWAVTLSVILSREVTIAAIMLLGVAVGVVLLRQPGQAVLVIALGTAAGTLTKLRVDTAAGFVFDDVLTGTLVAQPSEVSPGLWFLQVVVVGFPAAVPVLLKTDALPADAVSGAGVAVAAQLSESDRAGMGQVIGNATAEDFAVAQPATGMAAVAAEVKKVFAESVNQHVGPASRGLVPGMVLGDTSQQNETEYQLYIDTGLSHLSAVSGANVAIVTTVIIVVCRLLTVGPRIQTVSAAGGVLLFVGLVGTEPSVLRAAVTGLVGLLAVINSARMEPVHGLSLAVIGLLLYDSDLAVAYGFALSVAATGGIVALNPLLVRALAPTRLPDIVVRALAVAIAADVVTMPLIAMMAGRVSLVSVLANVLVSPAVPPVTVLGLVAAGLALLPGGFEVLALKVLEPCTWWIHQVATWCAGLPLATIGTPEGWLGPAWVFISYGWLIAGLLGGQAWKMAALLGVLVCWSWWQGTPQAAPEIPLEQLNVVVVDTEDQVGDIQPGTQVIVVLDPAGQPRDRPSQTGVGLPVLYPNRDGPVSLHQDGRQHAADGRF